MNLTLNSSPGRPDRSTTTRDNASSSGYIGMAVTAYAFLVADCLGECPAKRDADVLRGMVAVDMQVAVGCNVQIDQPVACNLIQHVIEERQASGMEFRLAAAIEIQADGDLGFQCVAGDGGLSHDCLLGNSG